MRILLDSRDLINVVEHGRPITAQEIDAYLRAGNHQIVLTFTNVRELSSPLAGGMEFMQIRPLLQSLEQMPHAYLKEVTIIAIEIQSAVDAFNNGTEYPGCSPYVRRWDYTLMAIPGQQRAAAEDWVNFRLDEIVYLMKRNRPDLFAPPERHLPRLRANLENDRAALRVGQAPARLHFVRSIKRNAARYEVRLPNGREDEFYEWVYSNPNRCPGFRLYHETYRAIMANYMDVPETADFSDLAHVSAAPYVDVATMDRRMRDYCGRASRKMLEFGAANNYADRLYHDVAAIIRAYP